MIGAPQQSTAVHKRQQDKLAQMPLVQVQLGPRTVVRICYLVSSWMYFNDSSDEHFLNKTGAGRPSGTLKTPLEKPLPPEGAGQALNGAQTQHQALLRRHVRHYHYHAWPDFGVPKTMASLRQLAAVVRANAQPEPPLESNVAEKFTGAGDDALVMPPDLVGPPVVHCSAGVVHSCLGTFVFKTLV